MALTLTITVEENLADGLTANITDRTLDYGIGGNPTFADIKATRFLFSTFLTSAPQTIGAGDELEQYREYVFNGNPAPYDGKTLNTGDIFIPMVTGIIVDVGDTFTTTGRYSPLVTPATYLPTAARDPFITTPVTWGLTTDTTAPFEDTASTVTYEVYKDTLALPYTPAVGETLIVVGNGTVNYKVSTYRQGEVFTTTDTSQVTIVSGTPTLSLLASSVTKITTFLYFSNYYVMTLIVTKTIGCCNETVLWDINKLKQLIEILQYNDYINCVSQTDAQDTIFYIQSQYNILTNCGGNCLGC